MRGILVICSIVVYFSGCVYFDSRVEDACTHGNCKHGWYSKYTQAEQSTARLWMFGFPIASFALFSLFKTKDKNGIKPNAEQNSDILSRSSHRQDGCGSTLKVVSTSVPTGSMQPVIQKSTTSRKAPPQTQKAKIKAELRPLGDSHAARITFSTFVDASNFAKKHAQDNDATVKLEREDNYWVVIIGPGIPRAASSGNTRHIRQPSNTPHVPEAAWWERQLNEQRKREEQEQRRREIEERATEAERRDREQRFSYLDEREDYYRSLPEAELDKLWSEREDVDMEDDEISLLRQIVREVKGIKPVYGISIQVCRQCGMVGDNCTCDRSWF